MPIPNWFADSQGADRYEQWSELRDDGLPEPTGFYPDHRVLIDVEPIVFPTTRRRFRRVVGWENPHIHIERFWPVRYNPRVFFPGLDDIPF